jgi:hypothetical protein
MASFEMHPKCFHVTPIRRPNIERLGMLTMKGVVEVPLPQPDQTGPNAPVILLNFNLVCWTDSASLACHRAKKTVR